MFIRRKQPINHDKSLAVWRACRVTFGRLYTYVQDARNIFFLIRGVIENTQKIPDLAFLHIHHIQF